MKVYKIGRYYYREITENNAELIAQDNKEIVFALIDYDGEPFKFFKRVKDKKYKFYHTQPCDCDICHYQKEILKQ